MFNLNMVSSNTMEFRVTMVDHMNLWDMAAVAHVIHLNPMANGFGQHPVLPHIEFSDQFGKRPHTHSDKCKK